MAPEVAAVAMPGRQSIAENEAIPTVGKLLQPRRGDHSKKDVPMTTNISRNGSDLQDHISDGTGKETVENIS